MLLLLIGLSLDVADPAPSAEGHGFVITDTAPRLWWQRKPKAMPEEVAAQRVKRIAGTIERIASKQAAPTKSAKQEIIRAIKPQLEKMPGFDWVPVYQAILLGLHIRRDQQAEQEIQQEAARFALRRMRNEDDLLVLLMAA